MSSRFSTRSVSRSADSSMVATSSARSASPSSRSSERSADAAALMPASGVRRSWLTAASRAVRMLLPAARRSASAAWAASRPCCRATAACSAKATRTRRSLAGRLRPESRSARVSVTATSSGLLRRHRRRAARRCRRRARSSPGPLDHRHRPQPEGLADLLEQAGQRPVAGEDRTRQRREHGGLGPGAGGCGGPSGRPVDDGGNRDGHDQPAEQRRDVVDLLHGQLTGRLTKNQFSASPPSDRGHERGPQPADQRDGETSRRKASSTSGSEAVGGQADGGQRRHADDAPGPDPASAGGS